MSRLQEDFLMGAIAGAFAAAATTPLDVIKTQMMCTAASRPSMRLAARDLFRQGGPGPFFRWARGSGFRVHLSKLAATQVPGPPLPAYSCRHSALML